MTRQTVYFSTMKDFFPLSIFPCKSFLILTAIKFFYLSQKTYWSLLYKYLKIDLNKKREMIRSYNLLSFKISYNILYMF